MSLDTRRQELYDSNCNQMDTIIEYVLLCWEQNIAFGGHDDANSSESKNKGNFKAILEFRALGDQMLQKHLTLGPKMPNTPVQIHKMKSFRYANHSFCKR